MNKKEEPNKETKPVPSETEDVKDSIDHFGAINNAFDFRSDIQYLTIIGSIEGHSSLPPQDKTTKYENIIPS